MIDLEQLKADVAAGTPGPWNVESYECKADQSDVKYHETKPLKKGEKRKDLVVGDVLWSVPYQIGPIRSDHNHWAGTHLDVDERDTRRIARLPDLEATVITQAAEITRLRAALKWYAETLAISPAPHWEKSHE